MENVKKCSFKEHQEINAIIYCENAKSIYVINVNMFIQDIFKIIINIK